MIQYLLLNKIMTIMEPGRGIPHRASSVITTIQQYVYSVLDLFLSESFSGKKMEHSHEYV